MVIKLETRFKRLITFFIIFMCFQILNTGFCSEKLKEKDRVEYINIDFFQRFDDECLVKYVILGMNNNYNLKNLRLKINELYQVKNIEISKEFPSLSVGANYLGVKIPHVAFPYQGFRDNAFALPFMTMWEIDLFGKRKNKIEMKREDINAAI